MAKKWTNKEIKHWYQKQTIQRSYHDEVVTKLDACRDSFNIKTYASLDVEDKNYTFYALESKNFDKKKACVLITGGVHGYETSGVQGALDFLLSHSKKYLEYFNFIIVPCISPWAYESINRWNAKAIDPNRNFVPNSTSEEARFFYEYINSLKYEFLLHVDLHETTNSDNTIFRPALAKRDGIAVKAWDIPDGFYLVGDVNNPKASFQEAIIKEVKKVTKIAPSDKKNQIIGETISQEGVINYAIKDLGLCTGFTNAIFNTTTEVYPDSKNVSEEECIKAQVVTICSALEYLIKNKSYTF